MKKTALVLVVGMLLAAGSAYAAGDLVVTGTLAVGAENSTYKMNVETTDTHGLNAKVTQDTSSIAYGASMGVTVTGATDKTFAYGFTNGVTMTGAVPEINNIKGSLTNMLFKSYDPGTTNFRNDITAQTLMMRVHQDNVRDFAGADLIYLDLVVSDSGSRNFFTEANMIGVNINDLKLGMTNQYGIKIAKQTGGTKNYGIGLAGDGAGADIVFGSPNQEARIYSESGYLKAQDVRGNVTQFSPHDPVTGEWIFFSENIKTGEVVRVDMERLVRDMEKLTGNTYMVKTVKESE